MGIHDIETIRTGRHGVSCVTQTSAIVSSLVSSCSNVDIFIQCISNVAWLQSLGYLSEHFRAFIYVQVSVIIFWMNTVKEESIRWA